MKKAFLALIILFFFVLCSIFFATLVSAEEVNLELRPSAIEIAVKPHQTIQQTFKVINKGDPITVRFEVLPFVPKDTMGQVIVKKTFEGPIEFLLDSQKNLSEPTLLKTNETKLVHLELVIPEMLSEQDYYYTLLASTEPPPASEGVANVRAKSTLGSLLLITVTSNGQIQIKPKIELFNPVSKFKLKLGNTSIHFFDSFDSIPIVLLVGNTGKNLIQVVGEISEKSLLTGTKKYTTKSQTILAESQKLLLTDPVLAMNDERTNELRPKDDQPLAETTTSLILKGFHLGLYDLSASMSSGKGTPTLYGKTFFIAFPFKLLGITGLVGLIAFFIYKKIKDVRENNSI